jgi:hypothetical protein
MGMSEAAVERRQHPRAQVSLDATVTRLGNRALLKPVSVVDLSLGGALVQGTERLSIGDVIVLTIQSAEVTVEHQGLVVGQRHSGAHTLINVAFKTPDERAAAELRRLIDLRS